MQTSEQIDELITALAKAQGEFKPVAKSAENPFLKNRYATLDGVIDVIRGPLSKHGLAFVQPLTTAEGSCWLETRIMHSSGQWIATAAEIPEFNGSKGVNSLQSFGGALTYMRRYMLTSMLGINAEEDNDGNGDNGHKPKAQPHWIEDEATRKRFWAWTKDKGLTHAEVHEALKVKSLKEYSGTKGDAMTGIEEFITARLEAEQATA